MQDLVTTLVDAANAVSEAIAANDHAKPKPSNYSINSMADIDKEFIEDCGMWALRNVCLAKMHAELIEMAHNADK